MKKSVLTILVLCTLYLVLCTRIHAQTFDATKAYSDYQYQLSIYQKDYSDFEDAKTFYQANPTLQLKEEARKITQKMLRDRDGLMAVYLTALRLAIVDSTGFNLDQKNAIYGKIDTEIDWYKNHIENYKDSDELVDLFNKSDESKSRYDTISTPIIKESLFDIGLSQQIGIRLEHQKVYSDLKNYINEQVVLGKLKIDPFNRWLNDTDSVLQLLQKNEVEGATKIQTLYTQNYGINSISDTATQILTSSIKPLSQLNSYLTEMRTSIQNQMK